MNPEEWGWVRTNKELVPIQTNKDVAPLSLLKTISCACKKGCAGACSCRKAGLKCSSICKHCCGQQCENVMPPIVDDDEEDSDLILEPGEQVELSETSMQPQPLQLSEKEPGPSKRLRKNDPFKREL